MISELYFILKDLFLRSYCNYTQAILFENITEEEINEVETFVRDEMFNIILENGNATSIDATGAVIIDKKQMIEYFGDVYAMKPEKFRFQPGDRKFIKLIQQTITKTIEKKGRKRAMKHFGYTNEPPKKKFKGNENTDTECTKADINLASEMKANWVELVLCKLKSFAVPHNFINMFNESFVSVDTSGEKILKGGIVCVVCAMQKVSSQKKSNQIMCFVEINPVDCHGSYQIS